MYVKLLTNNFLSEKAVGKSESKDVHLAVLRVLPEVIRESVDAERHADYRKGEGGKGTEGERRDAGRIVAVNQGKRDGSGVDADASSKSVIIYDPATGEKKMVSPTAVDGIESLGEVKTAEQREAEINAHMQDTIQRSNDWLEGNVANPVGMQIQLGDGRIATIEAMHEDGKSAIATLPDGTQFLVPNDVLQMIVNYRQYADYKARRDAEASKREAEQSTESAPETATEGGQPLPEEASPKEEERREYAQGDVFDVVVDGNKMHAEIVSPKDADGRFVVNVDDGESMRTLYVTPEELAAMEYREDPSPKAEETRLATEDSSDKAFERGAQPTEEHTPTALERIPRDEKGNAQFHDVDTETAWDGLVEMSGNDETAHKVAEASLANAERKLKAAKALKEKGDTPEELLQSINENEAAVAEAQRTVDAWKAIVGEKSRREEAVKAEAERIATEKAEAERKAAEERERAEAEEKTRIEAEKKEAERIAAEKAEEEARVEAERKAEEERIAKQKTEEKTEEAESDKEEAEKQMDDEEPKPVGSGVFGNIYNQFKGKVKEAFDFLMKHKGGDLLGVFHRKDVGDIDLVWGDHGGGLAHIIRRHIIEQNDFKNVDEIQKVIEDVIRNGLIIRENKDKINIEYNGYRVSIKKTIRDSKGNVVENKNWIVTAFDKSKPKHEKRNPSSSETLTTPSANQKADGVTLPSNEDSTDKGSKKTEKKQEKQSVFDKAKEIADKEVKKRKAEAEDDSALGQATRAVGKKKKVNLFKYTASKIISYPTLRGVHYANGYAYASDGYILFKEKADYPKEWEGTTRDKDGNLIDGKYPDAEKAIHRLVHIPDKEVESLPSKEVLDFAIAASKKLKGEAIPVAIDGIFFNAVNLKKFLEAVASKGMDKVVYRHPMLYATNGKDEIIMMPIVNTLEGALDIADRMESAGLPKEQIDAWNAHIEAADKKMSLEDFKKAVENAKKEGVRHTEAEKPKEQPLTEAERKDAEEVAGALGYRVEWVDTMEENGTIDADKKVIRIAKDAENPLVQVLGHEVAHGVKRMDGGKFRTLQKAAKEVAGEKEWNERIEKKRKLNAYAEGKLAEEVTCDIVGEALNDKDALKRLAESLRGENGILARLRDTVARMVKYFKNRGDKEGVRRMKAADKLLAEFESALKEGVAPEQVKPEDVDRSVRENRSEKTELTAEERELRDNLVERMRKGGLDVVTDSEEMQRVIDTENERTRNKRSKKNEAARKRDEALYAVDWSTAFVSGKSREEATEIRRERGRKFKEETKELYGRVLSGNFDDVTLQLIDEFIDKSTPNNPYERPISKRLPTRALQKMRGGERTGSVDALFSRICESAVGKDGKALPRAERERAIEEKKKELLKKWAIATGNWHTDIADFTDQREPIGSGTDSDVYLGKDGKSVIKVSKGKPYGKRFRPDVDNVALFNSVFRNSAYTIVGYGEVDGKFVRFLKQPIVDFTSSTPLTEGERVAYMEKLGFKPINKENTAFSNGEIIASDLQKSNIVKDKQGNVRVIDADMKLHTKDFGGKFSYPDAETDTRTAGGEVYTGSVREHRVYHGSGADFDAFDHSHMGEGEGAQAYGWGTYVTEVEGIGRTYAIQNTTKHNDALRALQHDVDAISDQLNRHRDDLKYDEEQLKRANEWRAEAELDYELFKDEAEKLKEKYGESSPKYQNHLFYDIYTDEMKRAQSSVKSTEESIQYRNEKIAELEKALKDKQAEIDELPKEFPRHLYTVEIPDDNGSNYLDWNGHPAESLLKDVGSFLESNGFERVQDSPVRYEKGESTVVLNPNATGADLYAELREALGSDKKASQALAELGCIGIKYPADNMRGGRKDGAKNYVIFNENDAKITDHTRFLRTASGEVYGLVKDGRIYLDPKVATAETAVHEYTHLWGDMLRRKDSEQWSHTVKELKNSVLWEEVKELYPELKTDDEIADEVLSTFSGRRGAERLREEARRVADGDGGVFTKAKAIETLERVKEAIARFWEGVARMFGINRYRSAEELADMAMKDLLDSKNPMKDESGMRKRGEVGDEGVKSLKGEEAMVALDNIFEDKKTENMPQKVSSLVKFMELFRKPVRTFLGEVVNVKEEVYNKIIREKRTSISGAVLPTLENADFAIRDTDGSTLYIKRFKSENNDNVYNIAVVNKYGEVEDYVSSVHIKSDNNLRNKITKGAELLLPQERITDGILPRNNPTPTANVTNISEPSKPRFSRKPGESIFDYASRVSEDVDRSVRERVSARDEYEKKVKSKGFQTKEALQNSMLGLQEFMSAIDRASGNKRYIEDIPDFENPILGENRLSSVNKEEMHQVAKTQFKPLMSAVAKLSGNGKESGELYDYMFAKHGLERDAVMRQREAQKEFDKYQKANPKGTKTIGDFVASLEGKDYAGLTALTAEDGRVKSIQSQIDAIDEQMKATDDQLLLRKLGGQKKRLKVDLLNAARDAADDIRKTFENNPSHDRSDINELWKRVNEVNGNTLRKLYESGMLTKEAYDDISSMYTNYIPMRGFDQTTSADAYAYLTHGDSAFNAPIKTAKGRSSKADNPIAYMQAMAESAIMQGNRNVLVKQKMLNFVRNHPSDLASVSDVWLQYDSVADEWKPVFPDNIGANDSASVVAKKMEAFEDKMKQMAEKHPDLVQRSNEAPDIPYKVVEKGQLNEHQVLVKQNGKSYIITVNGSPRAAQAANGLTNPDTDLTGAVGKVFEGAEALNRQLSSLYTTLNPDFIGSNYVRDALYSNTMVYVKEGAKYGGSFNLNFAKYNPAEMANLYARYNKGSLDTSNETHRLFLEFMQNGGETGFVNLKQIEKRKSEIAKAIKRDGEISAAQIWGGLNDAIDFANRAVENSARFAAYVTSRKSGRSVGRSVYDAKEISVNFNRKGSGRNWWKDNVGTSRFYDTEIGLVEINRASVGSSLAHRYTK